MSTVLVSAKNAARIEARFGEAVLFEVASTLHKARRGEESLPSFTEAKRSARASMAANRAIRGITSVCRRGDDAIWLVTFGPRGGWKRQAVLSDIS